jgi:hypothetical protein
VHEAHIESWYDDMDGLQSNGQRHMMSLLMINNFNDSMTRVQNILHKTRLRCTTWVVNNEHHLRLNSSLSWSEEASCIIKFIWWWSFELIDTRITSYNCWWRRTLRNGNNFKEILNKNSPEWSLQNFEVNFKSPSEILFNSSSQ